MSSSHKCGCKPSTEWPFYCHCTDQPYSYKLRVPAGHQATVRVFSIDSDVICGIAMEQEIRPTGVKYITPPEGSCCRKPIAVCLGCKGQWFPYKEVVCHDHDTCLPVIKPFLLTPYGTCEEILKCGCYRFVAYDANYDPVIPEPTDIVMQAQIEAIC